MPEPSSDEISWMALEAGVPMVSRDGETVGRVARVLGDLDKDIFDGIAFGPGGREMLPARVIGSITRSAVHLTLRAEEVPRAASAYREEPVFGVNPADRSARWRDVTGEKRP